MAASFVQIGTVGSGIATAATATIPATATVGNLLVATWLVDQGTTGLTVPSGWTQITSSYSVSFPAGTTLYSCYRLYQAGDANPLLTFGVTGNYVTAVAEYTSVYGASPIGAVSTSSHGTTSTHTSTALTTTRDGSLVVLLDGCLTGTALTTPSGWSSQFGTSTANGRVTTGDGKSVATSGSSSGTTSTTGGAAGWFAYQFEIESATIYTQAATINSTSTVNISKGVSKLGSIASSSVVSITKTVQRVLALAINSTSAVGVSKVIAKGLSVASSSTVSVASTVQRVLALTINSTASVLLGKGISTVHSFASNGTVTLQKVAGVHFSFGSSSGVSLGRVFDRTLTIASSSAVSISKSISKLANIASTSTLNLGTVVGHYYHLTLTIASTSAVSLTRLFSRTLTISSTSTVSGVKLVAKRISVASSSTVGALKSIFTALHINSLGSVILTYTGGARLRVVTVIKAAYAWVTLAGDKL